MQINVPCILYEGTLRSVFEVDKSQLQIFHALESDRHEIFQWLMSSDGKLSSDDNDKDHHEKSLPYGTIMSLQFCWIFAIKI